MRPHKKLQGKRKKKRKIIIGENEKAIIRTIGLGSLVIASFALPGLPVVLKPIMEMRGSEGFQKLLDQLKNKNIITLGGDEIKLTKRGQKLLEKIEVESIEIKKPDEWDGIWWLVSYDIPNELNNMRDYFRALLKRYGFHQIQASLWVHPYDCREEIAIVAQYLDISEFVIIMSTDHLPKQEDIEQYFNL